MQYIHVILKMSPLALCVAFFLVVFYILTVYTKEDDLAPTATKDLVVHSTSRKYRQRIKHNNNSFRESDLVFTNNPRFYFYLDNEIKTKAINNFLRSFSVTFLSTFVATYSPLVSGSAAFIASTITTAGFMIIEIYNTN